VSTFIRLTKEKSPSSMRMAVISAGGLTQIERIVEAEIGQKRGRYFGRHVGIGREFLKGSPGRQTSTMMNSTSEMKKQAAEPRSGDAQNILAHEGKNPVAALPVRLPVPVDTIIGSMAPAADHRPPAMRPPSTLGGAFTGMNTGPETDVVGLSVESVCALDQIGFGLAGLDRPSHLVIVDRAEVLACTVSVVPR